MFVASIGATVSCLSLTLVPVYMGTPSHFVPLTKRHRDELCQIADIPPDKHDRFVRGIEKCIASFLRLKGQKSGPEVEMELRQLERRVRGCLRLADHKKWRSGKFLQDLEAISGAMRRLSPRAHEYLEFRNVKLVHAIPEEWPPVAPSKEVVDPICFSASNEQLAALADLGGALAGPIARKRARGRPRTDLERALYHSLAVAFTRDTGLVVPNARFLAVCDVIRRIYRLKTWNPESLERLAALSRAEEVRIEQEEECMPFSENSD